MALVIADRVKETSTSTGTGTISVAGAAPNFRGLVAGIGTTNQTYYSIVHWTLAEWELGIGTVTDATPDTLSRTTVLASSNAGALVDFSAGTKDVFVTLPAAKVALLDLAQTFTAIQTFTTDIRGGRIFTNAGDYTSLVNDAPWYGIGPSNLNYGGGVVQVAGWGGLNFQTGLGRMIMRGDTGRVAISPNPSWLSAALLTVDPNPSANWTISGSDSYSLVTIPNDTYYDLAVGSGIVMVHPHDADWSLMVFGCSSGQTWIISDHFNLASTVVNTASRYNFYYNAGVGKYALQNKRGASRSVYITSIMTRWAS